MLSESPLSTFKDYELLYRINDEIKYTVSYDIPISMDKDYNLYWAIGPDSMLYLCDIDIWDKDEFDQKIKMNVNHYMDSKDILGLWLNKHYLFHISPSEYMRHVPIEKLTGQKFRQSSYFNKFIMLIPPVNANGVMLACWYSDTLCIKKMPKSIVVKYKGKNELYEMSERKNTGKAQINSGK